MRDNWFAWGLTLAVGIMLGIAVRTPMQQISAAPRPPITRQYKLIYVSSAPDLRQRELTLNAYIKEGWELVTVDDGVLYLRK